MFPYALPMTTVYIVLNSVDCTYTECAGGTTAEKRARACNDMVDRTWRHRLWQKSYYKIIFVFRNHRGNAIGTGVGMI